MHGLPANIHIYIYLHLLIYLFVDVLLSGFVFLYTLGCSSPETHVLEGVLLGAYYNCYYPWW